MIQYYAGKVAGAAVYLLAPDGYWPWIFTREENFQILLDHLETERGITA